MASTDVLQSHVSANILLDLIAPPHLPPSAPEEALIREYVARGEPHGTLIYASWGETWTSVAPGLSRASAAQLPTWLHGYQLSLYGVPALQRVLRDYVMKTHRVPERYALGEAIEVAVATHGTRAVMFDFGRKLLADSSADSRRHVVLAPMPGWDYAGVFAPLGFRIQYLPLLRAQNYQPDPDAFDAALRAFGPDERLSLMVLNPQHNPSGANWNEAHVRHMIRGAISAGAAILIDDAYLAIHDPDVTPTSALRVLMEELADIGDATASRRWLLVRSLGKQFNCNGWGIGAIAAHPATLDLLIHHWLPSRGYTFAGPQQWVMASWIDTSDAHTFLAGQRQLYQAKRAAVADGLRRELGYPPHALFEGTCTSYILFDVPPRFVDGDAEASTQRFLQACARDAGVLLQPGSMTIDPVLYKTDTPKMRMYLGPHPDVLRTITGRLQAAGLTYG